MNLDSEDRLEENPDSYFIQLKEKSNEQSLLRNRVYLPGEWDDQKMPQIQGFSTPGSSETYHQVLLFWTRLFYRCYFHTLGFFIKYSRSFFVLEIF